MVRVKTFTDFCIQVTRIYEVSSSSLNMGKFVIIKMKILGEYFL